MVDVMLITLIGLIAGAVGSIAGIGGGVFMVPALLYVYKLPPQHAAGTSLVVVVFIAVSAILVYHKQGRIDYRSACMLLSTSIPGAIIGSYIGIDFPGSSFTLFYGILLWIVFLFMFMAPRQVPRQGDRRTSRQASRQSDQQMSRQSHRRTSETRVLIDASGVTHQYHFDRLFALTVSFCIGMISSLFGIGGGALLVPSLIVLFSFPAHIAAATSMLIVFISACFGSAIHILYDHVLWRVVILLIPGAYLGGRVGAKIAARMQSKTLLLFLRMLILLLAVYMIVSALRPSL